MTLALGQFSAKDKKGTLRSRCKSCQRDYAKSHYEANRPTYVAKALRNNANYRARADAIKAAHLCTKACCKCSGKDDLIAYAGGAEGGKPVWSMRELSEANFRQALEKSETWCRSCFTKEKGKSLEKWQGLTKIERAALMQQKKEAGHEAKPPGFFKNYRRVGDDLGAYWHSQIAKCTEKQAHGRTPRKPVKLSRPEEKRRIASVWTNCFAQLACAVMPSVL